MGGAILKGVAAHQDLGYGLNVVLVEQPDFQGGDLLWVADADDISDPHPTFPQEVPGPALNAERIVVKIVSQRVDRPESGQGLLTGVGTLAASRRSRQRTGSQVHSGGGLFFGHRRGAAQTHAVSE